MPIPYVSPKFQAIDANGKPLVGGKLYTYANTTTTPQATFQDATGTINNTNPIILDGRGEAVIFLTEKQVYTFVLRDSLGALVWSQDGIAGSGGAGSGITVVTALPASDVGPVYLAGQGIFTWNGSQYLSDYSQGFGGGAYSNRNRLTNGDFERWSAGTAIGPVVAASGATAFADNWQVLVSGTASFTLSRVPASTDYAQGRVGAFTAKITSNAAATPAAGDRNRISQNINGANLLTLALGSIWGGFFTVSFWVKASIAGTYNIAFNNGGVPGYRSYVTTFTVNTAGVFEFKTVTIPADQSGIANWSRTGPTGLNVVFDLGSGATFEGAVNTWLTSETLRSAGSVRLGATSGATLELSQTQLEMGSKYTPFEDRSTPNGRLIGWQIFGTAGTFTYAETEGTNSVIVEGVGGGAGAGGVGSAVSSTTAGSGGGAGAYGKKRILSGFSGVSIVVGAAGIGGSSANGLPGGTSSFGALMSLPGGSAGVVGNASATPGLSAGGGGLSTPPSGADVGNAGESGEAGIGFTASCIAGRGGNSPFGSGGGQTPITGPGLVTGKNASGHGSGGGGAAGNNNGTGAAGGTGTPGLIIVWEYA